MSFFMKYSSLRIFPEAVPLQSFDPNNTIKDELDPVLSACFDQMSDKMTVHHN